MRGAQRALDNPPREPPSTLAGREDRVCSVRVLQIGGRQVNLHI